MGKMKEAAIDAGEDVMKAIGELHATTNETAKAATENEVDQDEVEGWLTTIFKAIIGAIKH